MKLNLDKLPAMAAAKEKENKLFFKKLKQRPPRNLDIVVSELHDEVFEEINCLECGNCCRNLGPRITSRDIGRLSKFLNLKPEEFTANYLRIDEDNDFVFKSMPCPFLGDDNFCAVYEKRPKACAEYPHTNRRKFHQILTLTLKNTKTCPAVYEIVERMKEDL